MDTKQEGLKLSKREREVMQLLAGGRTVKCVALELGLSFATADTYVRRVYSKLCVHSRAEAVCAFLLGEKAHVAASREHVT